MKKHTVVFDPKTKTWIHTKGNRTWRAGGSTVPLSVSHIAKLVLTLGFTTMIGGCFVFIASNEPKSSEPTLLRICNDTNGMFRGHAMSDGISERFGQPVYVLAGGGFAPLSNSHVCP